MRSSRAAKKVDLTIHDGHGMTYTNGGRKGFVENEGFELVKAPVKWLSPSKEEYKNSIRFLGRFFYSYVSNYTGTNEFRLIV